MKNLIIATIVLSLVACASAPTQPGGRSASNYRVGPGSAQIPDETTQPLSLGFSGYSIVIPPFDPGIPTDPNEYEALGVWPELRRTEAVRFPVELQGYLESKDTIAKARVVPNTSSNGHFYLLGEIVKSNGEDLHLGVELVDISGRAVIEKTYKFRVGGYEDPRATSTNKYSPLLLEIAEDIDNKLRRIRPKNRKELNGIEAMRFAESFEPEYFSQYLNLRRNRISLVGLPADDDPEYQRIKTIRLKDELFIDNIQKDYGSFVSSSNVAYKTWQDQAFVESKARREAVSAGRRKLIGGILVAAVGVAMLGDVSPEEYATSTTAQAGAVAAGVVAVAGVVAAVGSRQDFGDAKSHVESLNEVGKSINSDLAPQVMEIEDKQVELTGTAEEQYEAWRNYLRQIYIVERTPDREL